MMISTHLNRPLTMASLAIACCAFVAAQSLPAAVPSDLVQVELRAKVSSIKPGQSFTVGVLFHIQPGWHIYWKNPGDSGLPTRIKWNLPAGFTAGPLFYPVPKRMVLPGPIINYGYEDQVLLMADITPPMELHDASVDISADASWLVCQKACVAGKASAKLTLPAASIAAPANDGLFDQWLSRVPMPAEILCSGGILARKPLDLSTGDGSTDIFTTMKDSDNKDLITPIPDAVEGLEVTIDPPVTEPNGTRYPIHAHVLKGQQIKAKKLQVLVGKFVVTIPIIGIAEPATAPFAK